MCQFQIIAQLFPVVGRIDRLDKEKKPLKGQSCKTNGQAWKRAIEQVRIQPNTQTVSLAALSLCSNSANVSKIVKKVLFLPFLLLFLTQCGISR